MDSSLAHTLHGIVGHRLERRMSERCNSRFDEMSFAVARPMVGDHGKALRLASAGEGRDLHREQATIGFERIDTVRLQKLQTRGTWSVETRLSENGG